MLTGELLGGALAVSPDGAGDLHRCKKEHAALAEWGPSADGEHWVKLG